VEGVRFSLFSSAAHRRDVKRKNTGMPKTSDDGSGMCSAWVLAKEKWEVLPKRSEISLGWGLSRGGEVKIRKSTTTVDGWGEN